MYPQMGPLPAYAVGWLLAIGLAGVAGMRALRHAGTSWRNVVLCVAGLSIAVPVAGRLLSLLPALWGAGDLGIAVQFAFVRAPLATPEWLLLTLLIGAPITWALGLSFLRTVDVVAPAGGLLIFGARIGCFLEGCCFGATSPVAWAVSFPHGSTPYWLHLQRDQIWIDAATSLPVHPVQLYFALLGLLLFLALSWFRARKRFDGEVALLFLGPLFWATWLINHFRAFPDPQTQPKLLAAAVVLSCVTLIIELSHRCVISPWQSFSDRGTAIMTQSAEGSGSRSEHRR